jgi:UDP-N-acetylmuramoyl-L-alanyl-D-glutamate--2,6-diaminopimelate ligase
MGDISHARLRSLAWLLDDDSISAAIKIADLKVDSRKVAANDAFVAIKGSHGDGRMYVENAIENGAAVILVSEPLNSVPSVPVIVVAHLESRMGYLAAKFYAADQSLRVSGITGTNGKTTCAHLLAQLLNRLGLPCGLIGTLGCGMPNQLVDTGMTTPDVFAVHKNLAIIKHQGGKAVAMEVSSHGLDQGRVDGGCCDSALISNLTRDHFDYHGDMQAYGDAKKILFLRPELKYAVLNADDEFTYGLRADLAATVKSITYSTKNNHADVWVESASYHSGGIRGKLHSPWGEAQLSCSLLGPFNLSNVLAVVSLLGAWGYPLKDIMAQVEKLVPVPGRMQIIPGQGPLVIVDYAHTPDALEQALTASRIHCAGNLRLVFGCGGDRDQGKRRQMGEIANHLADQSIVTSDNPRGEKPESIIDMIVTGFDSNKGYVREVDRAKAITLAITKAADNDCVLIAGKGHENYQELAAERIHFSDAEVALRSIELRGVAS